MCRSPDSGALLTLAAALSGVRRRAARGATAPCSGTLVGAELLRGTLFTGFSGLGRYAIRWDMRAARWLGIMHRHLASWLAYRVPTAQPGLFDHCDWLRSCDGGMMMHAMHSTAATAANRCAPSVALPRAHPQDEKRRKKRRAQALAWYGETLRVPRRSRVTPETPSRAAAQAAGGYIDACEPPSGRQEGRARWAFRSEPWRRATTTPSRIQQGNDGYRYHKHISSLGEYPAAGQWSLEMNIPLGDFNRGDAARLLVWEGRASSQHRYEELFGGGSASFRDPRGPDHLRHVATSAGSATPVALTSTADQPERRWSSSAPYPRYEHRRHGLIDRAGRGTQHCRAHSGVLLARRGRSGMSRSRIGCRVSGSIHVGAGPGGATDGGPAAAPQP